MNTPPSPSEQSGSPSSPLPTIGWAVSTGLTPYLEAVATMERQAAAIRAGSGQEMIWLLEHPPLFTAGTSAKMGDLLRPDRFPVFETGRGGEFTYHGPGQRVAYVMLDVRTRFKSDVHTFITALETWLIDALADLRIDAVIREGRVGVWVPQVLDGQEVENKIAAAGIRVRQGVSFHGVSLNVSPDLSHFSGIVPCGIRDHGVTSMEALGRPASMSEVDAALRQAASSIFGSIENVTSPL